VKGVAVTVAVTWHVIDLQDLIVPGGSGAPGRVRTGDISLTRRVLWPTELQGRAPQHSGYRLRGPKSQVTAGADAATGGRVLGRCVKKTYGCGA
jgi:hypothetical protein